MITETFKITRQWILAGKAIFTVKNDKGDHYTYRIDKVQDDETRPPVWFLKVLTGQDNENDYTYVGMVVPDGDVLTVRMTAKSKYHPEITLIKVAKWALKVICNGSEIPAGYSIDGEGRCGRCGKTLTHPDGIADDGFRLGFGPHCWEKIQAGE